MASDFLSRLPLLDDAVHESEWFAPREREAPSFLSSPFGCLFFRPSLTPFV